MSTLKVNTVQHNTSGFNNVVQFTDGAGTQNGTLCRAWVNFNGTGTVAIRASFNVSSITDNNTGEYTVNFSNSFSDTNYSVSGSAALGQSSNSFLRDMCLGRNNPFSTSSVTVYSVNSYTSAQDCEFVNVTIHR